MDTEKADQSIAETRANLSELLSAVRLLRRAYFLTSRGKRQAAVVPAELGEAVERAGGPDKATAILANHHDSAIEALASPAGPMRAPVKAAPAPIATAQPTPPKAAPARRQPARPAGPGRGPAISDARAAELSVLAHSRASTQQRAGLDQAAESVGTAYRDFAVVAEAQAMKLLTTAELHGKQSAPEPEYGGVELIVAQSCADLAYKKASPEQILRLEQVKAAARDGEEDYAVADEAYKMRLVTDADIAAARKD
jgi:hypothetical protein